MDQSGRMSKDKAPTVSVVIPTFNRAHTLPRAVQSVLTQSYQDFEILIVDDGSTDSTDEAVQQLGDRRIRYFKTSENRGAAAARNTGIRRALGSYIAFLDSDDEWYPEKLGRQMDFFHREDSQAKGLCTGTERVFVKSGMTMMNCLPDERDWRRELLTVGCYVSPGSTLMVRRDVFGAVGLFEESLRRYEDWDWLILYTGKFRLRTISEPLARIYVRGRSNGRLLEEASAAFIARNAGIAKREYGVFKERGFRARLWRATAQAYFWDHRWLDGVRNLVKSYFLNPLQIPGWISLKDSLLALLRAPKARRNDT